MSTNRGGLRWRRRTLELGILPWSLQDPKAAILALLDGKIGKFDRESHGILISYKSVKVLQNLGTTKSDNAEIHMNVQVDFLVFQPEVGTKLKGIINKKSITHLSVLVYKIFNVVIPRPTEDVNVKWKGDQLEVGQTIPFTIVVLDLLGTLPYIRGELDEKLLNSMDSDEDDEDFCDGPSKLTAVKVNFDGIKPKIANKLITEDKTDQKTPKKRKLSVSEEDSPNSKKICLTSSPSSSKNKKSSNSPSKNNIAQKSHSNNSSNSSSSDDDDDDLNFTGKSQRLNVSKTNTHKKETNSTSKTNICNDNSSSSSSDEDSLSRKSDVVRRLQVPQNNGSPNIDSKSRKSISPKSPSKIKNENSLSTPRKNNSKKTEVNLNHKSIKSSKSSSSSTSEDDSSNEDILALKSDLLKRMRESFKASSSEDSSSSDDEVKPTKANVKINKTQNKSKNLSVRFDDEKSEKKEAKSSKAKNEVPEMTLHSQTAKTKTKKKTF